MSRRTPDISLLVVGKIRAPHDAAAALYEERIARYVSFAAIEVAAEPLQGGEVVARRREAERLRKKLPDRAHRIALSPRGRMPKSDDDFARQISLRLDDARPTVFVIGGPAGLEPSLEADCEEALSLGRLTLPHQLVRVVLGEQIYRALAARAGHPYSH